MVTETATPKGYKKTDIGVIPDDWEVKQIQSLADVEGGFAFSSKKFVSDGNYQVIKMSNLYRGNLDLDRSASFLNELDTLEAHYLLKKNDILITLTGTVGKRDYGYTYRIRAEKNLLLNQRVARIIAKDDTDPVYFDFQLKTPHFLKQFFDVAKGGTGNQANVGTKDIEEIIIPLPPTKTEQTVIALALSETEELIAKLEELITKKRSVKQGAMQELITGKKRLPGFNGKWETKKMGEVAEIKTGKKNNDDKVEEGLYPFFVRSQQIERINSYSFDGEAILIPGEGNIGSIYHYINGRFDYHQRVYKISNFAEQYSGKFIYLSMSQSFNAHAMKNSVKATVDSLRLPTFQEFEITFPPTKEEQIAIAQVLSDMDVEIDELEEKLDKYRDIKQGMMQELLTGKTRLI